MAIIIIIGVIFFLLLWISIAGNEDWISAENVKREAREKYENSLVKLREDPSNPSLRTETLRLGRDYSRLTRDSKGVTIFDEVALMNDIEAACAGKGEVKKKETEQTEETEQIRGMSIEQRLDRLQRLKLDGYISDEEYGV